MTYEELSSKFDRYDTMISEVGFWNPDENKYNINLSSILTELIKKAGQYCDYYASDLFYNWEDVQKFLSESKDAGYEDIFLFGFYKAGVSAKKVLLESSSIIYRKILALRFRTSCFDRNTITADLVDLTSYFYEITD